MTLHQREASKTCTTWRNWQETSTYCHRSISNKCARTAWKTQPVFFLLISLLNILSFASLNRPKPKITTIIICFNSRTLKSHQDYLNSAFSNNKVLIGNCNSNSSRRRARPVSKSIGNNTSIKEPATAVAVWATFRATRTWTVNKQWKRDWSSQDSLRCKVKGSQPGTRISKSTSHLIKVTPSKMNSIELALNSHQRQSNNHNERNIYWFFWLYIHIII